MQGIELVESRLFKVVKITDRDKIEKHHHATQATVFEKNVKVHGLEIGCSAILAVQNDNWSSGLYLRTSSVEHVDISLSSDLPIRLTIKTLNTIYILDEVTLIYDVGDSQHSPPVNEVASEIFNSDKELVYQ